MAEIKVLQGKKTEEEEGVYVNPITPELFKCAQEWIEEVGCAEIQIILTSGCMQFSEVFDSGDRTEAGLGAMQRYTQRYSRELDADWFEE